MISYYRNLNYRNNEDLWYHNIIWRSYFRRSRRERSSPGTWAAPAPAQASPTRSSEKLRPCKLLQTGPGRRYTIGPCLNTPGHMEGTITGLRLARPGHVQGRHTPGPCVRQPYDRASSQLYPISTLNRKVLINIFYENCYGISLFQFNTIFAFELTNHVIIKSKSFFFFNYEGFLEKMRFLPLLGRIRNLDIDFFYNF